MQGGLEGLCKIGFMGWLLLSLEGVIRYLASFVAGQVRRPCGLARCLAEGSLHLTELLLCDQEPDLGPNI